MIGERDTTDNKDLSPVALEVRPDLENRPPINCLAVFMRSLLRLSVCLLLLALPVMSAASGTDKQKLIVGGDHHNPPYEFLENGQPSGFNIELMQAAAEVLGLDIEIRLGPWNKARQDLEQGKIDLLTGMYFSAERGRLVDFSVPHTMVSPGLFVRPDSPVRSFGDLRGKEIIVQDDDVIHDLLKKDGIASRIVAVTDPDEVLRLLASGKYDCALVPSRLQAELFIKKYRLTNIEAVAGDLPQLKYCFAAGKGNHELLSRLDEGLNILKSNGKYQEIYEKWFGVFEKRDWWKTGRYIIMALMLFGTLFAASLVWSRSLKRQVELRTAELRKSEDKLLEAHSELESRVEKRSVELKAVNEQLRNAELEKSLILNSSTDLITFQDLDMRILWANQKAADELDMTTSELVGRHCYELRHQRSEPCPGCPVVLARKTGSPQQAERPAAKAGGTVFIRGYPVKDDRGNLIGMAEIVLDITERKRMEETLRESGEKYRHLVQNANSIILRMDWQGRITFFNEFAQTFFGYAEEEIIGRNVVGTIVPETESSGRDLAFIMRDIGRAPEKYGNNENENVRRNGERVWIAWTNKAVLDSHGNVQEVLCIGNDITDHKKSEEELRKYREGLERLVEERTSRLMQANRELESSREQLRNLYAHKQSMIEQQRANIAREVHDELGQMLTVLKMDLVWIKDRLRSEQQTLAEKLQADIRVTDETIQTVKKICTELRPGILDMLGLAAAIDWKASDFQKRTGIRCRTKIESDIMNLDKDRRTAVFRIFQEALTNILRHSKATEIRVSLNAGNGRVILEVCDNGIGISGEQLSKQGSFGLLGMRERVYPWGGEVTIIGIPEKGTTVRVSLPVSRPTH